MKSPAEIQAFLEQRKKQSKDIKDLKSQVAKSNHQQREYDNLDFLYANIGIKGEVNGK